jgi:DNA-binding HxlR family transcriptional regulator
MPKRSPAKKDLPKRRSPCPVACALDLMGDRWTLLIVRDLLLGRARFKDFAASPEGIPTNILSERLKRLLSADLAEQVVAADGSRHPSYRLTRKGSELRPILLALKNWGLAWENGARVGLTAAKP